MAASKNPNVHLEAMKEAENQIPQPDKTGCARMLRADGGVQRTRFTEKTRSVTRATTNERLIRTGYFELSLTYESIQTAYIGRAVCLTVRRGLVTQCY